MLPRLYCLDMENNVLFKRHGACYSFAENNCTYLEFQTAIMYDIVLFGATGFTGKLCAQFIAQNYPLTTRWCIAGRSLSRLETLAEELKRFSPSRLQPGRIPPDDRDPPADIVKISRS
jgi:hypothetical protein